MFDVTFQRRSRVAARVAVLLASLATPTACSEYEGPAPPADEIRFPVGMVVHPNGRYLYVSNSNFDLTYRERDGGTITVLDAATLRVLGASTVRVGSFAGDLVLVGDDPAQPDRLYAAVRGDDSLVALRVSAEGDVVSCPFGDGLACRVRATLPSHESREDRLVLSGGAMTVARVPTLAAVDTAGGRADWMAVASLGGQLHFVAVAERTDGFAAVSPATTYDVARGSTRLLASPVSQALWVVGRSTSFVRGVAVSPPPDTTGEMLAAVVSVATLPSGTESSEARDMAFSTDGQTAYVSTNAPGALFELALRYGLDGKPSPTVTRRIDVDGGAGPVVVRDEAGRDVVYISLLRDRAVAAYDAASGVLLGRTAVPGRPYALALHEGTGQLFVALFDEHRVLRIDLADPASPSFRTVVASSAE